MFKIFFGPNVTRLCPHVTKPCPHVTTVTTVSSCDYHQAAKN